jgi:hypothetical protein
MGGDVNGGALLNAGPATAVNCTFVGSAAPGGAAGRGGNGGLRYVDPNLSYGNPGGNGGNGGSGFGAIADTNGLLRLVNCTVAANTAQAGSGGTGGYGTLGQSPGSAGGSGVAWGGLQSRGSSLVNTLLATNLPGGNCIGTLADLGHNLSSDASCVFTNSGSLNSTDPLLGPLAANGGPTLTMALLPGSPAINGGDPAAAPATDQRGYPRPVGPAADIGAFEYGSIPLLIGLRPSGAGGFDVAVSGATNRTCVLQTAASGWSWTPMATNQAGADGTTVFPVGAAAGLAGYYRVYAP